MSQNISQDLNDLITYYQGLINYNQKFSNLSTTNYDNLVKELIAIRQLLINKTTTNINAIYKPTERLFTNRDHFKILEKTVQFYKQNGDIIYPIPETENVEKNDNNELNSTNTNESSELQQSIDEVVANTKTMVTKLSENIDTRLSAFEEKLDMLFKENTILNDDSNNKTMYTELLTEVAKINSSIDNIMNQDSFQVIAKKSQDALTQIKTNSELVRSDLSKYDEFLTNHITKSSANVTEVIEKEYNRFVHRISSDVNAIVAGITEANKVELATQTKLVQTSLDKFENKIDKKIESKFLKWFSIIFFGCAFLLFVASSLSSSWTGNKISNSAKLVKLSVTCKPAKPVAPHKAKIQTNNDEQID